MNTENGSGHFLPQPFEVAILTVLTVLLFAAPGAAASPEECYAPGELIVRLEFLDADSSAEQFFAAYNCTIRQRFHSRKFDLSRMFVVTIGDARTVVQAAAEFEADPHVRYAEPNYYVELCAAPSDPLYGEQWSLKNIGQTGGASGADIMIEEAWNIEKGCSSVLIGVIDTGIDFNSEEFVGKLWTNPGEIEGNGLDDDGNGYIDDVHGYNFYYNTPDVMDRGSVSHGTHVSGIIAARQDNGVGVAGITWNCKVIALGCFSIQGILPPAQLDQVIRAVYYSYDMGVKILNNSWALTNSSVAPEDSAALGDAIADGNTAGILFVCAAGNHRTNLDSAPGIPASYDLPNVIGVAGTDHNDGWYIDSSYGPNSVHLAAPAVDVLSVMSGYTYSGDDLFQVATGTSFASPHVAGVAALVLSKHPHLTPEQVREAIVS
ncbi:MAG: S8 family serine peptidase, partial [Planctomycetota bacterium]